MKDWISSQHFQVRETSLTGAKETATADLTIFDSPMKSAGVRRCFEKSYIQRYLMVRRLKSIEPYQGLHLLKNCIVAPRCIFRLRSPPCLQHSDLRSRFDSTFRKSSEEICKVAMDDIAKIPTRFGGRGIRAITDLALSAHISSRCSSYTLCEKSWKKRARAPSILLSH